MSNFLGKNKLIISIFFIGLFMRLVAINQSFWLDEAIGALAVREGGLLDVVTRFPYGDNHPPLYYALLEIWSNIFGLSELGLRSLSVLSGLLTIYFTYKIAKLFIGKGKYYSIVTALLLATSPFHIYYSQEARMYILAGLFASVSVYAYIQTFKRKMYRDWVLYSLAITALIFTDYVPVFLLPVFWIYPFLKKRDAKWWKSFILAHLPLVILGLLWLPIFLHQSQSGKWLLSTLPAWRDISGGATLKQAVLVWVKFVLGRISLRDKLFYYSIVSISSVPFVFSLISAYRCKSKSIFIWLWLFVPLVLGFAASFWFPVFIYFRFVYVVPAFYLLIAWGIKVCKLRIIKTLILLSILLVNISGWLIYTLEPYQQREQWRQAVNFIEENVKPDTVILFENPEPFAPFRWYSSGKVTAIGATDSILANEIQTKTKTLKGVGNKNGIYYFEYLHDLHDPNNYVLDAIKSEGFEKGTVYDFFPGVGQVTYYSKVR